MRISQQIFPRVVALICTVNKKNQPNVMTASFLMPISFEPKILAFSISPKRYTFQNLKEVPQFSLNILSTKMKKQAEICGSFSGKEINKFKKAKLKTEKAEKILPPLIKCPISFECKVLKMEEFGDHFLVVAKVVSERQREKKFSPLLHWNKEVFMEARKINEK